MWSCLLYTSGDKKLALHLMPSGVMYEHAVPVIGNGVVVDPGGLIKEMAMLEAEGISCKNLKISCDAHVIMPYHKDFDGADEKRLGANKICLLYTSRCVSETDLGV